MQTVGAQTRFSSQVLAQLIGDRDFVEVRAVEFPNITMLLDAINTEAFTAAMDTLSLSADDHTWVVGVEQILPFEPGGSYFDLALQNINEAEAQSLLAANAEELDFQLKYPDCRRYGGQRRS